MSDRPKEPARTNEKWAFAVCITGALPVSAVIARSGERQNAPEGLRTLPWISSSSSSGRSLSIMSGLISVTGKSLCGQVGKCELMVRS